MIFAVPAVVTLVGLLLYLLVPGKAGELGRIAFGCGLVVLVLLAANETVGIAVSHHGK